MNVVLPIHPLTGDTALGFRRNGAPIWPIKGGSGEGEGGGAEGGNQSGSAGEGDGVKPEADPAKTAESDPESQLGDAGKKALNAERDARKAAEKARDEALAEVKRLQRSNAAVKGTDLEAIKAEIRSEFAAQLAETALKAEAKGRLHDPADALLYVKVADVDTSDEKAITAAIDKLLEERPYLAAKTADDDSTKPWGEVQGGNGSAEPEPATPEERMRRAYGRAKK